jgi:hypothetical protein
MFRRIELINHWSPQPRSPLPSLRSWGFFKHGLCGVTMFADVVDPWVDMKAPKNLNKNCRFFFTEKGWDKYGRQTVKACLRTGQKFRIIKVKEKSVDPVYRDEYQVAVRPRKKHA